MTKTFNSFLETLLFLLLIAFSITLALGKNLSSAVIDGLNLYFTCVFPALFPYFFITFILSSLSVTGKFSNFLSPLTKRFFGTSGAVGYAFIMSLISGYPVGAKIVADLKDNGVISQTESIRASALCSTSSPMFIIASVGSVMFKSTLFGALLYACHFICAILVGIIFSFYKKSEKPSNLSNLLKPDKIDNILYESVFSAVTSSLVVGGIITIFYLITEVLTKFNILSPLIWLISLITGDKNLSSGIVLGLFECTKGLKVISACPTAFALPVCAFICGFGGISVIMQSIAYLKKSKIKTTVFVFSKLISAVLNFFVATLLSLIFL